MSPDYDSDEPALIAAQDQLVAAMQDAALHRAGGQGESDVDFVVLTAFRRLVELERSVRERDLRRRMTVHRPRQGRGHTSRSARGRALDVAAPALAGEQFRSWSQSSRLKHSRSPLQLSILK